MCRVVLLIGFTTTGLLCGCGVSPQSLGITGPGPAPRPPATRDHNVIENPGGSNAGIGVSPVQRLYNYND
jgi:hypothetical protein